MIREELEIIEQTPSPRHLLPFTPCTVCPFSQRLKKTRVQESWLREREYHIALNNMTLGDCASPPLFQ